LAVAPIAGRALRPSDEILGSPPVALVGESLWRARYGSDPAIIGKTITLNGEGHEIIGVVPDTFRDLGRSQISSVAGPQLFVPLRIDPARENRGNHTLRVVGRLRAGVTLEQARAEMSTIAAAMGREFPSTNKGWGINLARVDDSMFDEGIRPSLLTLLGAVAMVMLIACANVSNLMLVKAIGRQRELALRTALGADRRRIFQQLLTESVCLAVVSSVLGMGAAFVTVDALRPLLPETLPRIADVRVDMAVVTFGLLITIGGGLLFGILPAIRVSRVDPVATLAQAGRGVAGSSRSVLRQGLVVAQVALATTLLVVGALLLQSFVRLQRVPLGFEPAGVLTTRIGLPRNAYPDGPATSLYYQRVMASLESDPDVVAAAVATSAPFTPGVRAGVVVSNRSATAAAATQNVVEHIVSEGYFRALAIPIVAGRAFDERDRAGSPTVVIVSQAIARQLWPGMNPIGRQLESAGRMREVVGVVGDVLGADDRGPRGGGLDRQPRAAMYLSATQFPQRTMTVLVRTTGEPSALVPRLRAALRDADPAIPIPQPRSLDDWLVDASANPRLTTTLAGAFAAIGMLLAAIGIYGVVAYSVGQRTPEIGLRMAVGATNRQIMALVLRGGMVSATLGTALGLGGALLLKQVLGSLLFSVQPDDPFTFAAAAMLLAFVALVACYVPARRATRVDPLMALRIE
jgi:putative ABC transport system permease protein